MNKELVSVVLPTYNRAHLIKRAIDSVLEQTYSQLELIIVDDKSTDNTEEVVKEYSDSRIKYIKVDKNGGPSKARNIGMVNSKGEYIAFQDSDDEWLPERLELLLNLFKNRGKDIGMVFSPVFQVLANGKTVRYPVKGKKITRDNILTEILLNNIIPTPAAIITKECYLKIGDFDTEFKCYEDYDFFIRVAREFQSECYPEPLLFQYETKGGVNNPKYNIQAEMQKKILEKHFDIYSSDPSLFAERCFRIGDYYCMDKNYREGIEFFKKTLDANTKKNLPYLMKYYLAQLSKYLHIDLYNTLGKLLAKIRKSFLNV